MFRNWGFLVTEIWLLVVLAALLGLFCGWLIWGRMSRTSQVVDAAASHGPVASAPMAAKVAVDTVAADLAPAQKPAMLAAPRGVADDLKLINGIGPALEELCHKLGIWHFDQIASWGAAEIAWMDSNLEGFKGRVTRDDWVGQARAMVAAKG